MVGQILYIGKNHEYIESFTSLSDNEIKVVSDHIEAIRIMEDDKLLSKGIVLFESRSVKTDVPRIQFLKSRFPLVSVILIACNPTKEEGIEYLKSGVDNMLPPSVGKETFNESMRFLKKYGDKIQNVVFEERTTLSTFRLPVWKRVFDIIFSLSAIIALSPILVFVSLAIRIESKGRIIYKSKRVGSNYRVFDFLKFRSMYQDADRRLREFESLNQYSGDEESKDKREKSAQSVLVAGKGSETIETGGSIMLIADDCVMPEKEYLKSKRRKQKNAFVKFENDPRITRVGVFIRKYSIDELPQLINILKGDMSVVGNRPLPLYEAELLTSDEYIERFMGPSGLTGLWQVEKRGEAGKLSAEERKMLDIYYAKNFSLITDIRIILKTFTAFIQKENV